MEKYCRAGQAKDDSIIRSVCCACRITKAKDIHSRVYNFCFSRATVVTRTSLNVTFIRTLPLGYLMRIPFFISALFIYAHCFRNTTWAQNTTLVYFTHCRTWEKRSLRKSDGLLVYKFFSAWNKPICFGSELIRILPTF